MHRFYNIAIPVSNFNTINPVEVNYCGTPMSWFSGMCRYYGCFSVSIGIVVYRSIPVPIL